MTPHRWLLIAIMVVDLLVAAGAWLMIEDRRESDLEIARLTARKHVEVARESVAREYEKAFIALQEIADEHAHYASLGPSRREDWLAKVRARHQVLNFLRLADAGGEVIYAPDVTGKFKANVADRAYFKHLRDNPAAGMQVTEPVIGRTSGRTVIVFAQRLNDSGDAFAGVAIASVATDHFRQIFARLSPGPGDSVSLYNAEGRHVARLAQTSQDDRAESAAEALSPGLQATLAHGAAHEGYYDSGRSASDGVDRIHAYLRDPTYGFLIDVGIARREALAHWRTESLVFSILVLAFVLGSMALAINHGRAWRRELAAHKIISDLEKHHQDLLMNLNVGLVVHAPDSRIVFSNLRAAALLGLTGDQMQGKTAIDPAWCFVDAAGGRMVPDEYPVSQVLRTSKPLTEFVLGIQVPGTDRPVWVLGSAFPEIDVAGRLKQVVVSFNDISERKQLEMEHHEELARSKALNVKLEQAHNQLLQSEKMASIGQLAAGVAHELNNPIGFIQSNVNSLEGYVGDLLGIIEHAEQCAATMDGAAAEEFRRLCAEKDLAYLKTDIRQLVAESKDGTDRVRRIVQNLKDFAHVSENEWEWADLHKGIDSTLTLVWNELKYKCEVRKDYGSLPMVYCLGSQINQVIMNLLVNAAQAIETRGTVTIRTGTLDAAGDAGPRVWIEVADTGKGIAPENLKRIFEPFFTTKPVGKGTGLGLSLAWGIVQRHHGTLEVNSEVGVGTTFRMTLPVNPGPDAAGVPGG